MSINLMKEELRTMTVICQKYSQTMAESDVIVPDSKPDVKKVLEVSGNVCITQKLIQQDKVFVQGVVKMTALYVPDDTESGAIKSLSASQEFTHTADCRGISPEMQVLAEAEPESFDCTLINSRKLNLRCVLGISVKVLKPELLSFTTGVEDDTNIALKREPLRMLCTADSNDCQIILREQLELPSGKPAIGEVLKITATPIPAEICMMENKAVAKGQVRVCTLYLAEDQERSLQFMEHVLPFTEILDAEGVSEGMEGELECALSDMYYEVREDADGEARNLNLELVLSALVRGSELREIDAVTDAYSLNGGLDITTKTCQLEQLLDNSTAEITVTDQAKLPPMLPGLRQVCDVNATAKIDRIAAENGQVTVYGTIQTWILYLSDDETTPISGFRHVSEFSHTFDVPGAGADTACDARVFIEHTSYTLSGTDSLELRFVIGLAVKSLRTGGAVLIEEMCEYTPEEPPCYPCMVLYFVQPGDSLWSIAKRYHTTVEDIKALNHLDCDLIQPGQRLKILAQCAA